MDVERTPPKNVPGKDNKPPNAQDPRISSAHTFADPHQEIPPGASNSTTASDQEQIPASGSKKLNFNPVYGETIATNIISNIVDNIENGVRDNREFNDHQEINMANDIARPAIPVSIKYALEAVPVFDGYNIPLSHFLEGCQEAEQMMPEEALQSLALTLRNKLRGEARRAVHGVKHNTVVEFMNFLKSLYAPAKTAYQLQGELGRIFQAENEGVLAYSNRVKDLGNKIYELHESTHNEPLTAEFKKNLDDDVVDCFARGLKTEIENKLTTGQKFDETMKEAIEIERKVRAKNLLRNGQSFKNHEYRQQQKDKVYYVQAEPKSCQICNHTGHIASECYWLRNRNSDRDGNCDQGYSARRQQQYNDQHQDHSDWEGYQHEASPNRDMSQNDQKFCRYCKKTGHVIEECQKREYVNSLRRQQNQNPQNSQDSPSEDEEDANL